MRSDVIGWDGWLTARLADLLADPELASALVATPERDLFEAGLDSLRAFRLLDDLADAGVDVDFTDLVAHATVGFLTAEIARAGIEAP